MAISFQSTSQIFIPIADSKKTDDYFSEPEQSVIPNINNWSADTVSLLTTNHGAKKRALFSLQ